MSSHATPVPGRIRRVVGLVLAVAAILHTVVIALWAAPDNAARDAVGDERLAAYVRPHFGQSWSVFAPVPRRVDEDLSIRAKVASPSGGATTVTKWFNITADDHRRTVLEVNPSRTLRITHALAGNVQAAFATFNLAQQDLVQKGRSDPRSPELRRALLAPEVGAKPATDEAISAFLRNEEMLVRFATLYATSRWGTGVQEVQYRLGRRLVPEYQEPERPDFGDVRTDLTTFGWREAIPAERPSQEAFDGWVER